MLYAFLFSQKKHAHPILFVQVKILIELMQLNDHQKDDQLNRVESAT